MSDSDVILSPKVLEADFRHYQSGENEFGYFLTVEGFDGPEEASVGLQRALNLIAASMSPTTIVRATPVRN